MEKRKYADRRKIKLMAIAYKGGACILVCANCHRELEGGITQLPGVIQVENEVNSGKPDQKGNPEPSRSETLRKV